MPAYKTFASYAEKLQKALALIEEGKPKQAATIVKRVQASAEKRGSKAKESSKSTTKRAPNKYMLYMQENRPQFQKDHPNLSATQVVTQMAAAYRKVKDSWEPSGKPAKAASKAKPAAKKAPKAKKA